MIKKKVSCIDCTNDKCLIKQHCPTSILEEVEKNKSINRFAKKQLIFHEGNETFGIYFILSGIVKIFKHGAFNKDQLVRISLPSNILGHRGFSDPYIYPISAKTITETEVCYFSKEYFFSLLEQTPKLAIGLMLFYADELNMEEAKLRDMSIFNVREKVAKALLLFVDKFGLNDAQEIRNIDIISRQDIAESVGLTPNQVTKVLGEFKEDLLIKTDGKKITLLNKNKLENIISI